MVFTGSCYCLIRIFQIPLCYGTFRDRSLIPEIQESPNLSLCYRLNLYHIVNFNKQIKSIYVIFDQFTLNLTGKLKKNHGRQEKHKRRK